MLNQIYIPLIIIPLFFSYSHSYCFCIIRWYRTNVTETIYSYYLIFRSSIIITISDIALHSNETFILLGILFPQLLCTIVVIYFISIPVNTTRLSYDYYTIINLSLKKKKNRRNFISWHEQKERNHKGPVIKFIISILKYYFLTIYNAIKKGGWIITSILFHNNKWKGEKKEKIHKEEAPHRIYYQQRWKKKERKKV